MTSKAKTPILRGDFVVEDVSYTDAYKHLGILKGDRGIVVSHSLSHDNDGNLKNPIIYLVRSIDGTKWYSLGEFLVVVARL
jgi:hypothetical protein